MKEQLISFETAKLAKEKGFNLKCGNGFSIDCHGGYAPFTTIIRHINTDKTTGIHYASPTQSLLQKWLREVYNIHIEVLPRYNPKKLNTEDVLYSWAISGKDFTELNGHDDVLNHWIGIHNEPPYIEDLFYHVVNTYEEALEIGLQEALKLI